MASRHSRVSVISDYLPLHVNATGTLVPVGQAISTTSATTISVGSQAVTPVSMTGITVGTMLNIANGTGTGEDVRVLSTTATTFTATFAYTHSGAYTIIGHRGTFLGSVVTNQAGSGVSITLYNGHPSMLPLPTAPGYGVIAIIQPGSANAVLTYGAACDYGLFYTTSGTMGDFTILYADMPA